MLNTIMLYLCIETAVAAFRTVRGGAINQLLFTTFYVFISIKKKEMRWTTKLKLMYRNANKETLE